MQPDLPTLLLADVVLTAGVALLMAAWGLLRAVPRGHWGWVAAPALAAAGAALQLAAASSSSSLLAGLGLWLLSLWPLAALQGLRRFDARSRVPGSAGGDALLAGLAALWALGLDFDDGAQRDAHAAVLASAVQACAAVLLGRAQARRYSMVLRISALTLAGGAVLQALAAWLALRGQSWAAPAALLLNALLAVAACGMAPLLAQERAENALRESRRRLRLLGRNELLAPGSAHFDVLARRLLRRETRAASVLLFDIDTPGRREQDAAHLLRRRRVVAHGVHATLRGHDLAGRHGQAFVLLLPGTTLRNAMAAAVRVANRVQALAVLEESPAELSLSFGVGELRAGEALPQGLQRARLALAEARRQGPGRAVSAAAGDPAPVFVESRRLGAQPRHGLSAPTPPSAQASG